MGSWPRGGMGARTYRPHPADGVADPLAGLEVSEDPEGVGGPDPQTLYDRARAEERAGDYGHAIDHFQQAYSGLRAVGESRRPALIAARELAFLHVAVDGNDATGAGWLARARRLLGDIGECPERGWVELAEALFTDDVDAKTEHVASARRIAAVHDDADLAFCALAYEGLCGVMSGDLDRGMRCVDEAAVAATCGEVQDEIAVGEIYCKMLLCCEMTLDVGRAQRWAEVASTFGRSPGRAWVPGICRMHYGGILTAAGRWSEADQELVASIDLHEQGFRGLRSGALARLADLRVRQGRYVEASRLLQQCGHDAHAVGPQARLHLARRQQHLAATVLRRHLENAGQPVVHAPLLALLAETEAALGRREPVAQLSRTLAGLARQATRPHLVGFAELTAALACPSQDATAAIRHLETALAAFARAGLPLEEARTRLALSRRLARTDREVAVAEATAAREIGDRLQSRAVVDAATEALGALGVRPVTGAGLTPREQEVLHLVADGMSNDAIARQLVISKRTVEHHVGSIFGKLGVTSRAEAIVHARR